ncbi:MAG: DUF4058 family protein [Symploca sp. SIO2E6]|nr:DUF4058 family protein [Symploca sp. SIO2E6]
MPSPFPGMNPYLEHPQFFSEVHHRLITALADAIEPNLSLKYRVAIEKRTYLSDPEESVEVGIPDVAVTFQKSTLTSQAPSTATLPAQEEAVTVTIPVPQEIREGYLEIREEATGYVVTTIEVLSPTNKRSKMGRQAYLRKRQEVLSTPTHLVEIDLLRGSKPMPISSEISQTDYRILIAFGNRRPLAQLYGFSIRQTIPQFLLPLLPNDTEPIVDVQSLLVGIYQRARYDMAVDYSTEPVPRLKEEDRIWADQLLREKGLRS